MVVGDSPLGWEDHSEDGRRGDEGWIRMTASKGWNLSHHAIIRLSRKVPKFRLLNVWEPRVLSYLCPAVSILGHTLVLIPRNKS